VKGTGLDDIKHTVSALVVALAITVAVAARPAIPQHFAADTPTKAPVMVDKTEMPTASDLSRSASRLAELRKHLRPYWSPGDAGGIFLLGLDEQEHARFFEALAASAPQLAPIAPAERPARLARILADDIGAFLTAGKLAPGPYQLDNYHLDHARDGKLTFNADGDPPIVLPAERTFSFTVTEEHLKLLRHLNTREWSGFIELMDPKRPYGDMTYYFIDMADALGEPLPPRDAHNTPEFTPQQIERYLQLHREMLFAAQAFWNYAQ
jgi:hypothetical protein